ncbi:MAG: hypothetical protein J6I46_00080 [Ruminococcus sp.]|nr:hypothetical protein [Ruminococcus sp.]
MNSFEKLLGKGKKDQAAKKGKTPPKVKKMATTVQEVLDFDKITEDGIILTKGGNYSKIYKVEDANFITESDHKQWDILENYSKFINRFPDNVDVSIIIVNKRNTMEQLADNYHIKPKGDGLDEWRIDYNQIIDAKITEGRNDISKEKYIMLNVKESSLKDAQTVFSAADISLQESVKQINRVGVTQLDAIERLRVMHEILNGSDGVPFDVEYDRFFEHNVDDEGEVSLNLNVNALKKSGTSVKDLIAPQTITKTKNMLQLSENRFAKSYSFNNLPSSLDTSFLTSVTNLPYEMVTVVQLKAVPRKKALMLVKMQDTSIKADVIKATQQAYKAGYSPDLINDDLVQAQNESKQLRNDVVQEGKKIFYATLVTTLIGESEEEMVNIEALYKSKCTDYSLNPNILFGQQVRGLNTALLVGNSKIIIDRMLTGDDACALFPFNIQELNDKKGHFYGINAQSKNMAMYDRKRSRLANGLIVGQSGSGKSFITKGEIIPNLLDSEDDMIILDPENEYRLIGESLGGTIIDLEAKSDFHINPCDMSMEWEDERATPLTDKCDYMVGLVESILGRNRECNPFEVNAIHRACNKMYEPYIEEMTRRHEDGDNTNIYPEICPTLVDFYEQLLADQTAESNKIAQAIEPYCIGNYNLFAHHTNIQSESRLTIFNLLYLPEKMTEMAMKVCLAHIWTRIVKNKELNSKYGRNKSIWVYLDEFHLFFKTESSASTILAYFKRVRKYGGIMTGITQDIADLLRTSQGTGMFNNTGFFIILKQSPVGQETVQRLWNVADSLIDYIKDKDSGIGLIYNNRVLIPMNYRLPTDSKLYGLMSTNPNDVERTKKRKAVLEKERVEFNKQHFADDIDIPVLDEEDEN